MSLPLGCQDFPIEGSKDLVVFCTGGQGDEETNPIWNGTLISREFLPPTESLRDPLPTADSCAVSSFLSPSWRIGNLAANTNPEGTVGSLTFQIELATGDSPGQYPATVIQSWQKLGEGDVEGEWYTCDFPVDGDQPEHLTGCTFRYDARRKSLELNATWTCKDLDKEHPSVFSPRHLNPCLTTLMANYRDGSHKQNLLRWHHEPYDSRLDLPARDHGFQPDTVCDDEGKGLAGGDRVSQMAAVGT